MLMEVEKWSQIHILLRVNTKHYSLLEGHPLATSIMFGRRPLPRSWVILIVKETTWYRQNVRTNDHVTPPALAEL